MKNQVFHDMQNGLLLDILISVTSLLSTSMVTSTSCHKGKVFLKSCMTAPKQSKTAAFKQLEVAFTTNRKR